MVIAIEIGDVISLALIIEKTLFEKNYITRSIHHPKCVLFSGGIQEFKCIKCNFTENYLLDQLNSER